MSLALYWATIVIVCTSAILSILGVITSSFNLHLFYSDSILFKTTRIILGYTSISDICFLAVVGIYEPLDAFLPEGFKKSITKPVLFYLLKSFELLRNWLYVLLSFERLFYIDKPLEFKQFWTVKAVLITISLITVTSFLLRIPSLFLMFSRFGMLESAFKYFYYIHFLTDCVFLSFVPECLMICVLVSTTTLVKKRNIDREKLGKQKTVLRMVKAFLVTFFILTLPSIPTPIAHLIVNYASIKPSETFDLALSLVAQLTVLFSVINSLSGFFIYMNYTARYRDALINFLRLQRLANIRKLFQFNN